MGYGTLKITYRRGWGQGQRVDEFGQMRIMDEGAK